MTCVSESVECVTCLLSDGFLYRICLYLLLLLLLLLLIMCSVFHLMVGEFANTDTLGLHLFYLRYMCGRFDLSLMACLNSTS